MRKIISIGNGGQWEQLTHETRDYDESDQYQEAWSVEQKLEMIRNTINKILETYKV